MMNVLRCKVDVWVFVIIIIIMMFLFRCFYWEKLQADIFQLFVNDSTSVVYQQRPLFIRYILYFKLALWFLEIIYNYINNSDFIDLFLLEYNSSKITATYNEKNIFPTYFLNLSVDF
jgi:hypothetical protein